MAHPVFDPTPDRPIPGPARLPRRPALRPGVLVASRTDDEVQVGAGPGRDVVLRGVPAATVGWLRGLDGTRTRDALLAAHRQADDVLRALHDHGLLTDASGTGPREDNEPPTVEAADPAEAWTRARLAPDLAVADLLRPGEGTTSLARRAAARVDVHGTGRLGTAVAALLAAAGVGWVVAADGSGGPAVRPADVGPCGPDPGRLGAPAPAALAAAVRRAGGAVRRTDLPPRAHLTVVAGDTAPDTTDRLLAGDRPHLLVTATGPVARVGPLVLPGEGPCCRCLDLHRADRDPVWPRLRAQRLAAGDGPVDVLLATAAAALAAMHAVAVLERRPGEAPPPTLGSAWECDAADLTWRRRSWPLHPACGCGWAARAG